MYFKLAWRNIWRNKRRTFISLGSITFAVLLACIMQSMQFASYQQMIDNAVRFHTGFIQIHKKGFWDEKSINKSMESKDSLFNEVSGTEGVKTLIPRIESFALASHKKQTKGAMIIGTNPEQEVKLTRIHTKLVDGDFLKADDQQLVIAEGLADYLEVGVNDTVVLIGQGFHGANAAGKYPVKGIIKYASPDLNNQMIYMPLKEAEWFFAADNRLTSIAIEVEDIDEVEQTVERIQTNIDTAAYEVMGWRTMLPELVQGIELDYGSSLILLYVLYAVIGFGIFGTILMMTNERKYEFGVLVAIGMRRIKLQTVLFLEIVMLALLGVLAGGALAYPLMYYLMINPIKVTGEMAEAYESFGFEPIVPFITDPEILYNQAVVVLIITIIIAIYPVIFIKRLRAVEAMRD